MFIIVEASSKILNTYKSSVYICDISMMDKHELTSGHFSHRGLWRLFSSNLPYA